MNNRVLTFIMPLRHPENSPDWRAIIVANEGAGLPALPDNFETRQVRLPPNPMFEQGNNLRFPEKKLPQP
jgi:hypothetical protein